MTPIELIAALQTLRTEMREGLGPFATLNCALAFVLIAQAGEGGLSIRDLALRLPDASNVCLTGVADRLEDLGVIRRETRRPDRRIQWLVPTDKGLSLARRVFYPFSAS